MDDLNDFIEQAAKAQNGKKMHEKREEIKKQREHDKREAVWQKMDEIVSQLQNDFKAFDGVKINPYSCYPSYNMFRVGTRIKTIGIGYCSGEYSRDDRFISKDGTFNANIALISDDGTKYWNQPIKLQIQIKPESTDEAKFILTSSLFTFDEAERYLDIPKDHAYNERVLKERSQVFYYYEAFKESFNNFIKATINLDSFREKHNKLAQTVDKVTRIG